MTTTSTPARVEGTLDPVLAVVAAWDVFSEAMDCSDAEEEMTERQRSKYSRLSDAIARLRTPANTDLTGSKQPEKGMP